MTSGVPCWVALAQRTDNDGQRTYRLLATRRAGETKAVLIDRASAMLAADERLIVTTRSTAHPALWRRVETLVAGMKED